MQLRFLVFFIIASVMICSVDLYAESSPAELSKAIASMRGIDAYGLSDAQQKAKAKELGEAWKTLIDAGPAGAIALKEELKKINSRKEKDDHFKLGTAELLWHIGKFEEVQSIAAIWSGDVDLNASNPYVFYTAFEAAQTQDIRVLPMLTALLGHHTGKLYIPSHSLTIQGPLFQAFIWGAFGSKGLAALNSVLQESDNERVLTSAIQLLARAQDRGALDRIREIAIKGNGMARSAAIQALGVLGHPQDFDFLVSGLKNGKGMDVVVFASALYEYDDLRAVPLLIPLLSSPDKTLGNEVIASLTHLITQDGMTALEQCARDATETERRNTCSKAISKFPTQSDSETNKVGIAAQLRERAAGKYRMKAGDRQLNHEELLKAAEEWKKNKQITGGTYSWVEDRHVMAAAATADIPLLMDVAAACYTRLSDECLYDVQTLLQIVQRLGRSRYRKDAGVCEKVEPL